MTKMGPGGIDEAQVPREKKRKRNERRRNIDGRVEMEEKRRRDQKSPMIDSDQIRQDKICK